MDEILDAWFARASVRNVTMNLVEHLLFDEPLTPAEITAFGIASEDHYRALQTLLRDTCSGWDEIEDDEGWGSLYLTMYMIITDLDQALGHGAKLKALVAKDVPAYSHLTWETSWDKLLGRSVPKPEESQSR